MFNVTSVHGVKWCLLVVLRKTFVDRFPDRRCHLWEILTSFPSVPQRREFACTRFPLRRPAEKVKLIVWWWFGGDRRLSTFSSRGLRTTIAVIAGLSWFLSVAVLCVNSDGVLVIPPVAGKLSLTWFFDVLHRSFHLHCQFDDVSFHLDVSAIRLGLLTRAWSFEILDFTSLIGFWPIDHVLMSVG